MPTLKHKPVVAGTGAALSPQALLGIVEARLPIPPAIRAQLVLDLKRLGLRADAAATPLTTSPQAGIPAGDKLLTSQEAADLVGVSRPFMTARIDAGDVPLFQMVGNQRRVLASAVLKWQQDAQAKRREAIAEFADLTEAEFDGD